MQPALSTLCSGCGLPLDPAALSCPSCHALVHAAELSGLAEEAKLAGQAGNWAGAKAAWERALSLLPPDTSQYQTVRSRIENIDAQHAATVQEEQKQKKGMAAWAARLGPVGIVLWKFKTVLLLFGTKFKLLLLGLTKISTLVSMLAFLGVYWTMFGWKFALGFVLSIYIHEMGHVASLRKYGIAASAPMFIPFVGAVVRLRQHPATVVQDARVGLAGPIWGLSAAIFAWICAMITGQPIWYAIARTGAWINLFNLIPIWQLDGGRGFRSMTRRQRGIALAVVLVMWAITEESMLALIAIGAGYRLFSKDYAEEPDDMGLTQYAGLIVLLSLLVLMCSARSIVGV